MSTCFVAMGFGEKTDLATGRKLNLDRTYENVIRPAVAAEGYECKRADEIRHSGMIDIPMYDWLFRADLAIVDLSTSNLNAIFELGVRYALKPRSTIIIAEKQFASPFDVNHILIHKYEHLGPDIGYSEVLRMQKEIRLLIDELRKNDDPDSPIYSLMHKLKPPFEGAVEARVESALVSARGPEPSSDVSREDSYAAQLSEAFTLVKAGVFDLAKGKLQAIYDAQSKPDAKGNSQVPRTRIVQQLALATYKAGEQAAKGGAPPAAQEEAYQQAIEILRRLDPEHTTDPETLGLWSAVHKRRSDMKTRSDDDRLRDLNAAIYSSERGFYIRQDYYNGINLAYLLDVRASLSRDAEQVADRTLADRIRRRVVSIAGARLAEITNASADAHKNEVLDEEAYWVRASLAEALIALRDPQGGSAWNEAKMLAPYPWMREATLGQLKKLSGVRALEFELA